MSRLYPRNIRARPFGMRETPFDPLTGQRYPVADPRAVAAFQIEEVGDNVLLCREASGVQNVVARPWVARRQDYDGQTIDGVTYTWLRAEERNAFLADSTDRLQVWEPDYQVGEWVLAIRLHDSIQAGMPAGSGGPDYHWARWEDLNTAGRRWYEPTGTFWHARVSSSVQRSNYQQWTYTVVEVEKPVVGYDQWTDKANGRTGDALNEAEDGNGVSGVMGNGVDTANLVGSYALQAIPNNTYVTVKTAILTDGTEEYWIVGMPNGVDGACP